MKTLLSFILLIVISTKGKCDFADYWTVSLNDSLIYDSRTDKDSWNRTFKLNLTEINFSPDDTLIIIYRTDTPCPTCEYNLLFTDTNKNKKGLLTNKGNSDFNKIKDLTHPMNSTFRLTFRELTEITDSTLTEVFYYKSGSQYLGKILEIE